MCAFNSVEAGQASQPAHPEQQIYCHPTTVMRPPSRFSARHARGEALRPRSSTQSRGERERPCQLPPTFPPLHSESLFRSGTLQVRQLGGEGETHLSRPNHIVTAPRPSVTRLLMREAAPVLSGASATRLEKASSARLHTTPTCPPLPSSCPLTAAPTRQQAQRQRHQQPAAAQRPAGHSPNTPTSSAPGVTGSARSRKTTAIQ